MTASIQTTDYPPSVFPTAEIEAEVAAVTVAYERMLWALDEIGFTSLSAWKGSFHEFVNRPYHGKHH